MYFMILSLGQIEILI